MEHLLSFFEVLKLVWIFSLFTQ